MHDDPHNLARFLDAQENDYAQALFELRGARKRSHWMWYIFPQFAGLGYSATSVHFAIKTLDEARAYLSHPLLGRRLIECAEVLLKLKRHSAHDIFGTPDDLKLRSSATLFAQVSPEDSAFHRVLQKYFGGVADDQTLKLLKKEI